MTEQKAQSALRETLSRALRYHPWFADISGLLTEMETVLHAVGGPLEKVNGSGSAADTFHSSWNGLRRSCRSQLGNLGPDHALSGHLQVILDLTDFPIEGRRAILDRYL